MMEPREIRIGYEREFLLLSDVHDGMRMRSSDGKLWSVHASVVLLTLQASARVGLVQGMEPSLTEFFDDLAEHWRGWDDVKVWRAYEGGLALLCSHDGLGHVTITVELHEAAGIGWFVRAPVPLDAGQLEQVARDVRRFVEG